MEGNIVQASSRKSISRTIVIRVCQRDRWTDHKRLVHPGAIFVKCARDPRWTYQRTEGRRKSP